MTAILKGAVVRVTGALISLIGMHATEQVT